MAHWKILWPLLIASLEPTLDIFEFLSSLRISVTRFGEISPLSSMLKALDFFEDLFSVWQNFEPILAIFYADGQILSIKLPNVEQIICPSGNTAVWIYNLATIHNIINNDNSIHGNFPEHKHRQFFPSISNLKIFGEPFWFSKFCRSSEFLWIFYLWIFSRGSDESFQLKFECFSLN